MMINLVNVNAFKINPLTKQEKSSYVTSSAPKLLRSPDKDTVSFGNNVDARIAELQNMDEWSPLEREELIRLITEKSDKSKKVIEKAKVTIENKIKVPLVDFSNSPDAAILFSEALNDIKMAGIDLSKLYQISPSYMDKSKWGEFDIDKKGNPQLKYSVEFKWKPDDVQRIVNKENWNGYLLCDNPKSLVYHLVGHFLHYRTDPEYFAENYEKKFKKFTLEDIESFKKLDTSEKQRIRALIKKEVGPYSFNKERDFPAEVFTGLMNGKMFSPEIMELYEEIGMPTPYPEIAMTTDVLH